MIVAGVAVVVALWCSLLIVVFRESEIAKGKQ